MLTPRYPDLPITARREDILAAIRAHPVVILAGETGSGKTTQLPKMCLEALPDLRGQIGCTQPRRVAAMSVSRRVAEELGVAWGREVGCKMRFNDDTSRETKIKFMTDGILLAEIQGDPMLRSYSALIIDEAHERSLNIDFLLGYLQTLVKRRPDLKLIVTSATIDTQAFSKAFGNAPILEVSGRTYPVDVRYQPPSGSDEDYDVVENAASVVEDLLIETDDGDILVFLPTEKEIRDTVDLIGGRAGSSIEVLPLFGRLSAADQQRVFQSSRKRRVVVSTNVAETSVTIPRIRFVIDSGLARISRYNPRTRTKRLPIEAVAQSSANQRAGRAGRVREGICIRLYEEDDFKKRPLFSQPEIQRANLAEVILRMKAFRLGDIEEFPFIDPPTHAAIRAGYELLHELGSLDDTHELTTLGKELARLPVDPTLGRMLLQAQKEGCVEDMLILASGLSVPDPRERPETAREQAAAAHKKFHAPESDFISFLKIWRAAPPPDSSANALRKFCKSNFLSFVRMKEWRDLWRQLSEQFRDQPPLPSPSDETKAKRETLTTDARIHRCILAGHLGHIALRTGRNQYKAAGNKEVILFPGSNFYDRRQKGEEDKLKQPDWIVAAEIVQTSQLFARTAARIDPEWVAEIGSHLVEKRYSDPHWSAKAARVLVTEKSIVHGLEVKRTQIDHGKINPHEATLIFIRGALLEGELSLPHRFFQNNQRIRQKIETALTRVRSSRAYAVEEHLFMFYAERLKNCSSVHDLNRIVTERVKTEPNYLCATEEDLTRGDDISTDLQMFPDKVALGNTVLPVDYAYKPGEDHDGVTVEVPLPVAEQLSSSQVQWLVPGHREEMCTVLLRALPRPTRRLLMPIEHKAREIASRFQPTHGDFFSALALHITQNYGVEVKATDWPPDALPPHLQPRLKVIDGRKNTVIESRDLSSVKKSVQKAAPKTDAWERAVKAIQRHALRTWSFGDLPTSIVVEEIAGVPVHGYPGLKLTEGDVSVILFKTAAEVALHSQPAIRRLAELAISKDLAWLDKELKHLTTSKTAPSPALSPWEKATTKAEPVPGTHARDNLLSHLLRLDPLLPLTQRRFEDLCENVRKQLPLQIQKLKDLLKQIDEAKLKLLSAKHRYPGFDDDLARLLPNQLLQTTGYSQLVHLPRYLKAMQIRAERASFNPGKDKDKAAQLADYAYWKDYVAEKDHETFRWLLEEFRVSLFAPELGTAQPVSIKRLESMMK
ncbi:MAG: ATP-dependent RNA helicase HrpA [Verrucomicrobiaceae bacterium]|nr:ATP-dependent RNA helicase HrpA [Verrucomicrobiaceae bacterium]